MPTITRCAWPRSELDIAYHDREWGVPLHDDQALFELLTLEGAQAGLSWSTILAKREGYREAFAGFDPEVVARFNAARVERLVANPAIVRHRGKIESAISNAKAVLKIRDAHGSLDAFLWQLVPGAPRLNRWTGRGDVPARTPESDAMSKALGKAGFRYVGSTICYAFMQASGMVNDHAVSCFRHAELASERRRTSR